MATNLQFISLNCNGLVSSTYEGGAGTKFMGLWTTLGLMNYPDVVGLQETHLWDNETQHKWVVQLRKKYRTFFSRGGQGSRGTAILVGINVPFKLLLELEDLEGRYTILKGLLCGELVSLVSIYAPGTAKDRITYFNDLVKVGLRGLLYLMGDYNSVVSNNKDRFHSQRIKPENREKWVQGKDQELIDFMEVTDVVDPWRERNPNTTLFSWENGEGVNKLASRIDMIAISRAVRRHVVDCQYYNSGGLSDHCIVWLKINCGEKSMGRGVFCIKPFVYAERDFEEGFTQLMEQEHERLDERLKNNWKYGRIIGNVRDIERELEDGGDITKGLLLENLQLDGAWWEGFKNRVRSIAIRVQKNCREQDAYEYGLLQREYRWSRSAEKLRAKGKINRKLRDMMTKEIFEQRLDDLKYNEKCNSTFLQRVSEKGRKQYLECIELPGGEVIEDRVAIMRHLHSEYTTLFEGVEPDREYEDMFFKDLPTLAPGDIEEGELSYEEMENALREMGEGKSPGIDGIGVEFYKRHFKKFGRWFTSMYNNCVRTGVPPKSWEIAILKLIPKGDGIPSFERLRPLSMICVDKKLGAKGTAKRVRGVLPLIVDEHQSGGVAGRDIQNSTLLIHLLIQFYTKKRESGYILSVDSRKAFDEVIREILWFIMKCFGFPDGVIKQIQFNYIGAKSKLVVNGFLSEVILFEKGVRQGCPLSSMLYTLFVEPLAIRIRRECTVLGFKLPRGIEIKMIQHSDDMNFLVTNLDSVRVIIRVIENYGRICGNKINKLKSFIIRIGEARNVLAGQEGFEGIKFIKPGETARILGYHFGSNIKEYIDKNWELLREKCLKVINKWRGEVLSHMGRMIVLNNLIIPKINYIMGVMELNEENRESMEKIMGDFLWNNKRIHEKPFNVVCWPQHRGGLGVVSLRVKRVALKLGKIKQYLKRDEGNWEQNALHNLMRYHMDLEYRLRFGETLPQRGGLSDSFTGGGYYGEMLESIELLKSFETQGKQIENMDKAWVNEAVAEKFYRDERHKRENWILIDEWGWVESHEKAMWNNIFHSYLDNKIKSFGWRAAHGLVLVKCRIKRRDGQLLEMGDGKCLYCENRGRDEKETVEHLLVDCSVASLIWDKINIALFRAGMREIEKTPETIIARRGLGAEENYVVAEATYAIWVIRYVEEKQGVSRNWKDGIYKLRSRLFLRQYVDIREGKENKWSKLQVFLRNLGVT